MSIMWRCIFATLILNKILIFPSVSAETKAFITIEDCRILTEHIPKNDVAYKAGVDVRGRPVKPADISPAQDFGLNDGISFLLILDVAEENRGLQNGGLQNRDLQNGDGGNADKQFRDHPGLEGKINLGRIMIKDGKATLDGKSLAVQHQMELNEFCQKSRKLP